MEQPLIKIDDILKLLNSKKEKKPTTLYCKLFWAK